MKKNTHQNVTVFFSYARNSQHFVKAKCSLLSSKEPATGPKPEQDDNTPNY